MENLFVTGHNVYVDPQTGKEVVYLSVKSAAPKRKGMRVLNAAKNGTLWMDRSFTLDEIRKEYPVGDDLSKYCKWGEQIKADKHGKELTNVFQIEQL